MTENNAGNKKVIILGAGLAGLGTALRLGQKGYSVIIIEKEPLVGGLGASVKKGNFIFDYGPHGYASTNSQLLGFFKELMGEDAVESLKNVKISFRGRLCQYPLQAADLIRNIGPFTSILSVLDYLYAVLKQKFCSEPDRNMQDWIVHRFGRTIYDLFFGPYTQKVWGVHPTKLDVLFPQHRIPHTGLLRVILKSFRRPEKAAERQEHKYCPLLVRGYYPARGSGVVPQELCSRIEKQGGIIHRRAHAETVEISSEDKIVVFYTTGGKRHRVEADYVVSTVPLNKLIFMLQPSPGAEVIEAARKLYFRSIRIIGLGLRRKGVIPVQSIYYTDKSFNRLSDLVNYGCNKIAPPGKSVLTAELTCDKGDRVWSMSDEAVLKEVIADLEEDGIATADDVEETLSLKVEHAYPIYLLGFAKQMKVIADFISGQDRLYSTGRQGTFQYVDMDVAFEMGRDVAERIASGLKKERCVFPLEVPYF